MGLFGSHCSASHSGMRMMLSRDGRSRGRRGVGGVDGGEGDRRGGGGHRSRLGLMSH